MVHSILVGFCGNLLIYKYDFKKYKQLYKNKGGKDNDKCNVIVNEHLYNDNGTDIIHEHSRSRSLDCNSKLDKIIEFYQDLDRARVNDICR